MHDLTYSEMKILEAMLDVYILHCTHMADRWRKAADYHKTYAVWAEKKVAAQRVVSYLLEGEHPEIIRTAENDVELYPLSAIPKSGIFGDVEFLETEDEVHGDDPR